MRFLLHGDLSPAVAESLREMQHSTDSFASSDLAAEELLEQCHVKQLDILTNNAAVARAAAEWRGKFDRCVVYLQVSDPSKYAQALERLFERYKRLSPRKLYTVTESRVKVRQLAQR